MCHDRAEALLIFSRSDEGTDHRVLFGRVAQGRAVYLAQPEQEAANVCISPQVTEILRGDKGAVVLFIDERAIVDGVGLRVFNSDKN